MKAIISLLVITIVGYLFLNYATLARAAESETVCGVSLDRIETYQKRISSFEQTIKTTLERFNVDEKFIWLAMVESGGKIVAESDKGACGLWQLTSATARHYGCTDRFNVEESTKAAAKYLAKLSKDFNGNTWDMIVAYNMGGSNYKKAGKPTKEAANLANTVTCLMETFEGGEPDEHQ